MSSARQTSTSRVVLARLLVPFQRFIASTAASGIILLATTVIALVWANLSSASYEHLWTRDLTLGLTGSGFTLSLHEWINDALMALFFLLVGLEIKRELLTGALSSRKSAALPIAAAFGGMIVPATIFALFNATGPGHAGWGIPMATDIAFALGVLAVLGDRVPSGVRVFLAALAIADDLGAVLVIALFYTGALNVMALLAMLLLVAALFALNRMNVQNAFAYLLVGAVLWYFTLKSGVHATVAGVLVALFVPATATSTPDASSTATPALEKIERALRNVVSFGIVPLFVLANAGVTINSEAVHNLASPISLGVALGLLFGKPVGILLASFVAVRSGVAELTTGVTWTLLHGVSWLGGIGFTMSLFVAGLAFPDAEMLSTAKLGVFSASICAGVVGFTLLRLGSRKSVTIEDTEEHSGQQTA